MYVMHIESHLGKKQLQAKIPIAFLYSQLHCCRASAGSRPYSWAIWDFSFNGSMVQWFNLWLQRCAGSGLFKQVLSYHFGLFSCEFKICAEIVVHRMFPVFLNGLMGKNRGIVRNTFSVFIIIILVSRLVIASILLSHRLLSWNQDCKLYKWMACAVRLPDLWINKFIWPICSQFFWSCVRWLFDEKTANQHCCCFGI